MKCSNCGSKKEPIVGSTTIDPDGKWYDTLCCADCNHGENHYRWGYNEEGILVKQSGPHAI